MSQDRYEALLRADKAFTRRRKQHLSTSSHILLGISYGDTYDVGFGEWSVFCTNSYFKIVFGLPQGLNDLVQLYGSYDIGIAE